MRLGNNPNQVLPNYQVEVIRSLEEFPESAYDLSNVIFLFSLVRRKVICTAKRTFASKALSRSAFLNCVWKEALLRLGNDSNQVLQNYQVEVVRNLEEFPELACDLSNVIFVQTNQKKNNLL